MARQDLPETEQLTRAYLELGPNARKVLLGIAERLVQGARDYAHSGTGDFDGKPRNWRAETLAECLDGMVYLTLAVQGIGATEPDRAELPKLAREQYSPRDACW